MQYLDDHTVVIESAGDLSSMLTANNTYTYFYLGVDIALTSGIRLHNSRTLAIIDGEYPQGSGMRHFLQDTGGSSGMIHKDNVSPLRITLQNLTIIGRNYYGMPRIADGNTEVTLTYQNVIYTGPQMTWHFAGTTRYIDCDITIQYAGSSSMHEVAEVHCVEIGGKTVIRHFNTALYAVFFFYKVNASLTILENAEVEIDGYSDFLYHEYPPAFIIEAGARFTLTTRRGMSRSRDFRVASLAVGQGASFRYIRASKEGDAVALYIDGAFTVQQGATVYMQADFTDGADNRLIEFTARASARGLYLQKPRSFVLYHRGPGAAMSFAGETTIQCETGQLNFWREAGTLPAAGGFDDKPLYQWHNPDWSAFELGGSAASSSTNITHTTLAPIEPPLGNLELHLARVFSVGDLPLSVDPVLIERRVVSGGTDFDARVRVSYPIGGGERRIEGEAGEGGRFSVPTEGGEELPFGTAVTTEANLPFLITKIVRTARYEDDLHIDAPETIVFEPRPISVNPVILPRLEEDPDNPIPVVVTDTRAVKTPWRIMLRISGQMRTPEGVELPEAVVFATDSGDLLTLQGATAQEVYTNDELLVEKQIVWRENRGVLARITAPIQSGRRCSGGLIWELYAIEPTE